MLLGGVEKYAKYVERKRIIKMSEVKHRGDAPVGIELYPNAFTSCKEALVELNKIGAEPSPLLDGSVNNTRTSSTIPIHFLSYALPQVLADMNSAVWHKLTEYATRWQFSFVDVESVSVQRYEPGQKYDVHYDDGQLQTPRVVSALLYLNDVDGGGETYFPEFDFKITPKAGTIAVFPSNFIYRHAALPPTKGLKYAAAYWAIG
jgi:hypothetical protein